MEFEFRRVRDDSGSKLPSSRDWPTDARQPQRALDAPDNGTGMDLQVDFNGGNDETTINEYRIMVVKAANAPLFDLTFL